MRTDPARTPGPAPVPPGWTAYRSRDGRLALAHPAGWRVLSEGDASVHFELGVGYVVAARLERGSVARKATENDDEGNLREMVRAASLPWQPLNRLDIVEQGLWSGSPYRGYYYYACAGALPRACASTRSGSPTVARRPGHHHPAPRALPHAAVNWR